jgi:hypothetical protein
MSDKNHIEDALAEHRKALNEYLEWDQKVKHLLKQRRVSDLTETEMLSYREIAANRDAAYDRMRHLERELLDNIPGASTGNFKRVDFTNLDNKD